MHDTPTHAIAADETRANRTLPDSVPGDTLVDVTRFGVKPDDGADCTPGVREALRHCGDVGARGLRFPAGRYCFHPDRAGEKYVFISNNDEGLRRIVFLLQDFEDFEIDGQGAEFIFRGLVLPFFVEKSRRLTLRNLSVDWETPFHCEGTVVASDEAGAEVELSPAFAFEVVNGRFRSLGASAHGWALRNMLAFDPVREETGFGAQDNYDAANRFHAEQTAARRVRFHGKFSASRPEPGQVLLLTDDRRLCPAVSITDSAGVTLEDVTIHHAGGMAVIAQRSADLALNRVAVVPRPGGGRLISATADATHFVSCRGRITLTDCVFRTQVDDATNVHGVYTPITARRDARTVEVRLSHPQQRGRHPADAGHRLQFVSGKTLLPVHEAEVVGVRHLNSEYTELSFADPLPETVREGVAVLDLFWQPTETIIRGCTLHGNRARGFLISVSGRVLIEDCQFHVPGAAVLIEGDANHWFESGPVNDVTIRRNRFVNCNYGPEYWGAATVQVSPQIEAEHRLAGRYHRSIRIEDNHFEVFQPTLLAARSVDGLTFENNSVVPSRSYPAKNPGADAFKVQDCSDVRCDPA